MCIFRCLFYKPCVCLDFTPFTNLTSRRFAYSILYPTSALLYSDKTNLTYNYVVSAKHYDL